MEHYKHIVNWRDKRGSELDRAKKIVKSKNIKGTEIERLTGIPYPTLRNYINNPDNLGKASWANVNKLSRAYDIFEIHGSMNLEDVTDTVALVSEVMLAAQAAHHNQPEAVRAIKAMSQIIIGDPVALFQVFKSSSAES